MNEEHEKAFQGALRKMCRECVGLGVVGEMSRGAGGRIQHASVKCTSCVGTGKPAPGGPTAADGYGDAVSELRAALATRLLPHLESLWGRDDKEQA